MSLEQSTAYAAERIIRRFASATNLLIASRTLRVHGEGPVAQAVSDGLTRMGARVVEQGDAAQLIFVVGEPSDADAVIADASASSAAWGSAVVVDGTTTRTGLGLELARAFSGMPSPRRGLNAYSTDLGEVFLVDARIGDGEVAGEAGYDPEPVSDAAAGIAKIAWAERFMPVTRTLSQSLADQGAVRGLRIAVSLVLEPKTAVLALALANAGAEVSVWCDADGTRNDVVAALRERGLQVFADGDGSARDDYDYALDILRQRPQLLIDDGSSLIRLAHSEMPEVLDGLIGAAEETTSGLRPLRVMQDRDELKIPVIAVNDARCKTLFDNAYGTGQSCLMTILDLLDQPGLRRGLALAGATVAVAGFGYVGTGVARHAAALGATVVVSEVDPVAALQAAFAGYQVAPLAEAVASADLIIASTGIADTVTAEALVHAKEGSAVAVAGGVDQEIAINDLISRGAVRTTVAPAVEHFQLPDGPGVFILDNGECINCTAGEGNPVEIMDLSFGVQLSALDYLLQRHIAAERGEPELAPGVHKLPDSVDDAVSRAALAASGITIDRATSAQQDFLHNWLPIRFAGFADGSRVS